LKRANLRRGWSTIPKAANRDRCGSLNSPACSCVSITLPASSAPSAVVATDRSRLIVWATESAFACFRGWRSVWLMLRHDFIASLFLVGSFVFSSTLSAQTSSVEGNVVGADGRPLKDAEIRFEQREGQVSPIISRTDANGHYTAALPRGVYKLNLVTAGKVNASITVRATGANSRIDFDLRPSAEKKIKHYVWVGGGTGSHLPGRWVEAGIRAARSPTP
jgi:Carboxypeptidase regulatory-like domain